VTIEPCTMCYGALVHARIERLVFGATETKAGVVVSHNHIASSDIYNHRFDVTQGVLEPACTSVIQRFFKQRREEKRNSKQQQLSSINAEPSSADKRRDR